MTRPLTLHVGTIVDNSHNRLIATSAIHPFATFAIRHLGAHTICLRAVLATHLYAASANHRSVVPVIRPAEAASHRLAEAVTRLAEVALPALITTAIDPGVAVCPCTAHLIHAHSHTTILHHVAAFATRQ